jgi:hypothetical protein
MPDLPTRLTEEQIQNPSQVVYNFFFDYNPAEVRAHLENFLECALTTDNPPFSNANDRSAIWVFTRQLEKLLEAAYVIHLNNKKEMGKTADKRLS